MNKIIASIIAGIFTIVGVLMTNSNVPASVNNIDASQNKTVEDSHDTIIINTTKMTKINNAENVIIE